jgi:hypothetical protein
VSVAVIVGVTASEDTPLVELSDDFTQYETADAGASVPVNAGKLAQVPEVVVPVGLAVAQPAGLAVGHATTETTLASAVVPEVEVVVTAVEYAPATEPVLVIVIAPAMGVALLSVPP